MLPVVTNHRNVRVPTGFDWLDQEINRFARQFMGASDAAVAGAAAFPVDIHEDSDVIRVDAELPGFTKDEINVTMEKGVLEISAERSSDNKSEENKGTALVRERRFTRFARSFKLPTPISEEDIKATFENGVLHLTLPKRPEVKPRRITVS